MFKRRNSWVTDFWHDGKRYKKSWGQISKTVLIATGLFLLAFLLVSSASASGVMRCDGKLVQVGDRKAEIITKCGEPFHRAHVARKTVWKSNKRGGRAGEVVVERWTYRQKTPYGGNYYLKILIFEGVRLVNVETGDRF